MYGKQCKPIVLGGNFDTWSHRRCMSMYVRRWMSTSTADEIIGGVWDHQRCMLIFACLIGAGCWLIGGAWDHRRWDIFPTANGRRGRHSGSSRACARACACTCACVCACVCVRVNLHVRVRACACVRLPECPRPLPMPRVPNRPVRQTGPPGAPMSLCGDIPEPSGDLQRRL